jgi:hypothetical protein
MEIHNIPHHVRTWVSFDSPQRGGNIPLGIQHWLRFFALAIGNEGAAENFEIINSPAAQQMMIYHHWATNDNTAGQADLRTEFVNELDAMGFPSCRNISIINGSGYGNGLEIDGGEQLIQYNYDLFAVVVRGNIWAVPDNTSTRIFEGFYRVVSPDKYQDVYVNNTDPYDGAPGGTTNTLEVLGNTDTGGFGDIIALFNTHCFIPSISSCAITNTTDPYYNIDENISTLQTPFDTLYYPSENQDHVKITPESYVWFLHEVYNFFPGFNGVAPSFVLEDQVYTYSPVVSDSNEWDNLTISAISIPEWLTFDGTTLSGTPANEDVGTYNIVLEVSDGLEETQYSFEIEVINSNDPPQFDSTPADVVFEDTEYQYVIAVSDPELSNNLLIINAVEIPDWLTLNGNVLSGTPENEDIGIYNIVLTVSDTELAVVQQYSITVQNVNDAPQFVSIPVDIVNEDTFYQYEISATDIDPTNDVLTIQASVLPEWLTLSENVLSGIPNNNYVGTNDVILTVSDDYITVEQEFTITVENVNDTPVFESVPIEIAMEDTEYQYSVIVSDIDPTEDILTLQAVELPLWLTFSENILSGTPDNNDIGIYNVILSLTDGYETVEQVFTINVKNVNDAPQFVTSLIDNATEDIQFQYIILVSDIDIDDVLTLQAIELPNWMSLNDNVLSGVPSNNDVGNQKVKISVSDGETSIEQDFTIVVENTNDEPLFLSLPIDIGTENVEYLYAVSITDIDPTNDILTLEAVDLPEWLSLEGNFLIGTPNVLNIGENPVIISLSDGYSNVEQSFVINVSQNVLVSEINNNIQVYPNPTNGVFSIENAEGYNVTIYDVTGKTVYQNEISTNISIINSQLLFINGLYIINLQNDTENFSYKLIIE